MPAVARSTTKTRPTSTGMSFQPRKRLRSEKGPKSVYKPTQTSTKHLYSASSPCSTPNVTQKAVQINYHYQCHQHYRHHHRHHHTKSTCATSVSKVLSATKISSITSTRKATKSFLTRARHSAVMCATKCFPATRSTEFISTRKNTQHSRSGNATIRAVA